MGISGLYLHSCIHFLTNSPGKNIRVVDPFTIKPLDAATIVASARATGGLIITVEDHYKEGGFTCYWKAGPSYFFQMLITTVLHQ